MRTTIGLSLVLLVVSSAALARQTESAHQQPVPNIKAKPAKSQTTADKPGKRQRAGGKVLARGERRNLVRRVAYVYQVDVQPLLAEVAAVEGDE